MKYYGIPKVNFFYYWEYKNSNIEKKGTKKRLIVDVEDAICYSNIDK